MSRFQTYNTSADLNNYGFTRGQDNVRRRKQKSEWMIMDSDKIKLYLSTLGVLALIFGSVATDVSVEAGARTAGVVAVLFLVFALWGGKEIETANKKFLLNIVWVLAALFTVLTMLISVMAAVIVIGVLTGLVGGGLLYFFLKLKKMGDSLTSALTLDIRLEPKRSRHSRNREAVESLAAELSSLGFVPAGFFKIAKQDLFVEGWARPDLRLYAMITECGDFHAPYAEISAFYADGGSFCVSANEMEPVLDRPVNMVDLRFPGARPVELLNIIMQRRPPAGLLDTPPENFQATVEEEISSLREYLASLADDEEDEDDFYEARTENGR